MALTDVPFLFTWLLALAVGSLFLDRPSLPRAIALGVSVGLAQNFKYNGWLAGAAVAVAALPGLSLQTAVPRRATARLLFLIVVAAAVAALVYTPWFLYVEGRQGGYASLLAHHRGYLSEIGAWIPHWKLQLAQGVALSGGAQWGIAAWFAAWAGVALSSPRVRNRSAAPAYWLHACVVLLAGAALLGKLPNLGWWVGLAWFPWLLFDRRPAARVVAASWTLLSILTPFYHPYARLWLPVHAANWIILAGLLVRVWTIVNTAPAEIGALRIKLSPGIAARLALAVLSASLAGYVELVAQARAKPLGEVLRPTDGLRVDIQKIARKLHANTRRVKLLTRPSILFYLRHAPGLQMERLAGSSALRSTEPDAWALVEDIQLSQDGDYEMQSKNVFRVWQTDAAYIQDLEPADLLDHCPGSSYGQPFRFHQQMLWLLRPRAGGS
jgi:hypothetical protein